MNCRALMYPLFAIAGCQFDSSGTNDGIASEQGLGGMTTSAETGGLPSGGTNSQGGFTQTGGTSQSVATTGGAATTPIQTGGSPPSTGGSATGGITLPTGGTTATGGATVQTGGSPANGGVSAYNGGSVSTGGSLPGSGGATLLPPCKTLNVNQSQKLINTASSSYTSSFDIDCSFSRATLEVVFNGVYGPNYETPPIITLSNPSRTQSINTALFMPPISSDDCWSIKSDGSHDYNCAFSVASDVTGTLAQGNNTVYIVGKQGDTFTFTDIRITF